VGSALPPLSGDRVRPPGHGYSEPGRDPHTPRANAAAALGVIHTLGLRDVVVVGHSYGGAVALAMAMQEPRALRSIVVIGSRAHSNGPVEPLYRLLATPYLGTGVAVTAGALIGRSRVSEGIRDSFSPNEDAIPLGFIERQIPLWQQPKVATALAAERVTLNASLAEMEPGYRQLRIALDVVVGSHDRSRDSCERLAREVPGARLVVLERTGHYVQYVHPEVVFAVIERALSSAPRVRMPSS
jgi:pimeloyl-ACP methyl ester carboxylesterase